MDEIEIPPTEFEVTLRILEGLTRAEIADFVTQGMAPEEAANFRVLARGLSDDAHRFLAARTHIRRRPRASGADRRIAGRPR
jgi:hypothetical protein